VPDFQPYQLSLVPRTTVEDQFASIFTQQFGTSVSTTARELSPGAILPTSDVALDLRRQLGLRDRETLQEFEKALVAEGVPIAPRRISMTNIGLGLLALWALSQLG
jgi:hypothetical protein